jgi:hypothetical protein
MKKTGFVFSRKRHAGLEIAYIVWLGIDIICNFIVFIIVLPILKDYLFEPTGVINEDWTWLWSALVFYFIFCAFSMAIELGKTIIIHFYNIQVNECIASAHFDVIILSEIFGNLGTRAFLSVNTPKIIFRLICDISAYCGHYFEAEVDQKGETQVRH